MALSPSDIRYINKLLDRHLKNQRSWPWVRYVLLGCAVSLIGAGLWAMFTMISLESSRNRDIVERARVLSDRRPSTATSTLPGATQPVTYAMLKDEREANELRTRMEAAIDSSLMMALVVVIFVVWGGAGIGDNTLRRWNCHRRDAILIALLREKCAVELGAPSLP